MTEQITETIGRAAVLALANNYGSAADALLELIDNPIDYRKGRKLNVCVDVHKKAKSGQVTVLDFGGEGMDAEGLRDWIQWATGHAHTLEDIGKYHVGGKLAAVYLAESLEIVCRRAGKPDVYRFYDPHWGSRTYTLTADVETLDSATASWRDDRLAQLEGDVGFTLVILQGLKGWRYEAGALRERLGSTYRRLIKNGDCVLQLDGDIVNPLELPESATYSERAIEFAKTKVAPKVTVAGRIWVMEKGRLSPARGASIRAGIRTTYNGRLITQGEEFGYYLGGKGSLQRLMGEISIEGIDPTPDKTKWLTSDPNWAALTNFMRDKMQPLVAFLNNLSESQPQSMAEKKRINAVRRDLGEAFKREEQRASEVRGHLDSADIEGPGGRKQRTQRADTEREADKKDRKKRQGKRQVKHRTPPPSEAVGTLLRKLRGNIPQIDYQPLGVGSRRSEWAEPGVKLVINTDYPLYEPGSDQYLVGAICLHLLSEEEPFLHAPIAATLEQIDRLVWEWAAVVEEGGAAP